MNFSPTTAQFQQYVRIGIYHVAAMIGYDAWLAGSRGQMILGVVVTIFTLLWTAYATRIAAKINELVGAEVITPKVADQLIATANSPDKVVSDVVTKPIT